VLAAVERDVLNIAVLDTSLAKALEGLQSTNGHGPETRPAEIRDELARLETECGRFVQAIAAGGEIPAIVAAMQERERRRSHLQAELAGLERQVLRRQTSADVAHALDVMREALTDWQGLLRQETGPARQALRALLAGRLAFTPGDGCYTFEGEGTITPVLAGVVGLQKVAWPQRDSNPCFSLERAVSWASRRWGRSGPREELAGGGGFEPPLRGPEPRVLPLDDPPNERTDQRFRLKHRGPTKSTNDGL
jgi:hypothetical protein